MKVYKAILIIPIEYFDGVKMIEVKADTLIDVDLDMGVALIDGICTEIKAHEFKLFH